MKRFIVPVTYSFDVHYEVISNSAEEAETIIKEKAKISPGAVLSYSVRIRNKTVSAIIGTLRDTIEVTTMQDK